MKKLNDFFANLNKMVSKYYRKYFRYYTYSYIEDDLKSEIALGIWEAFKVKDKYFYDLNFLVKLIVDRKVFNFLKKKLREGRKRINIDWENFDIPVENRIERKIEAENFLECISKYLSEKDKLLLQKLLEGKKYKEISEEMKTSYKNIERKTANLKSKIRIFYYKNILLLLPLDKKFI